MEKTVASVKADLIDFMKEYVYRGDYERPRVKPDAAGFYHYRDDKLRVALSISPRDGWLNCSVVVWIVRRKFIFRRPELVLSTGYGYDVSVFRPGLWCDYVQRLAEQARAVQAEKDAARPEDKQEQESSFTPVDDASIFKR